MGAQGQVTSQHTMGLKPRAWNRNHGASMPTSKPAHDRGPRNPRLLMREGDISPREPRDRGAGEPQGPQSMQPRQGLPRALGSQAELRFLSYGSMATFSRPKLELIVDKASPVEKEECKVLQRFKR